MAHPPPAPPGPAARPLALAAPSEEAQGRAQELLAAAAKDATLLGTDGAQGLPAALAGLRRLAATRAATSDGGGQPALVRGPRAKDGIGAAGEPAPEPPSSDRAAPPSGYPALRAALGLASDVLLARPAARVGPALAPAGRSTPPTVRPSVRSLVEPRASEAMAAGAEVALYVQGDEQQSFDIALDESLLGDVRCRIALTPRGVEATFIVARASDRWLLDSQAQALRAQLEGRGLKVGAIRVYAEDDKAAPPLLLDLLRTGG